MNLQQILKENRFKFKNNKNNIKFQEKTLK